MDKPQIFCTVNAGTSTFTNITCKYTYDGGTWRMEDKVQFLLYEEGG